MWNLVRRAINRFLAAIFMATVGWWAKRYAGPVLVATLLFIGFAILDHYVGDWADGIGHFLGLFLPALMLAVSLMILVWSIQARALTPAKPSSTLEWDEGEMAEVLDFPESA